MAFPPARVVWYVTGRFYQSGSGTETEFQDVGYFLHLAGVSAALFTGPTSESTARFTFASEPFQAQPVTNGNLSIGLDTVGNFSVYLNPEGGATFDDPASFACGLQVATFRRASVVMGETLQSPVLGGLAISNNVFSADLVASEPFELEGARYDFKHLLPHGITQWGTASGNALAARAPYTRVVAFAGSAIAAG
ncbi:MAG TPA: hypothetical protein VGX68_11555 [Thermoanaerobaculia bacterium]|jgi:hypothetical protein|nr:hypothetical protein [Thermoanaerobaculia bacterium]